MLTNRRRRTLGKTIKIYKARGFSWGDFFRWFLPGMLLPLGLLAYGIWEGRGGFWSQPWYMLAAIATIPIIFYMIRHVRTWKMGVALNANGLRFSRLSKVHTQLYWTQITGIAVRMTRYHFLGLTTSEHVSALVYPTTGPAIQLPSNIEDLAELVERIKENLYPLLEPQLVQQLQQGKWLHFGPFHINQKGLRFARHTPTWDEVKNIQVHSGTLNVKYGARAKIRVECEKIPNLELMLELIDANIPATA